MRSSTWIRVSVIAAALANASCLQVLGLDSDYETQGTGGNTTTGTGAGGVSAGGSATTSSTASSGGGGAAGSGGVAGSGGAAGSGGVAGSGGAGGSGGTGGAGGCSVAEDCPTGSECLLPTCDPVTGQCGTTPVAADTPLATQTPGDCLVAVCDGAGSPVSENDDADFLDDGNDCTLDVCVTGVPEVVSVPAGTPCDDATGKLCDGQGACVVCLVDLDCVDPAAPKCTPAHLCVSAQCDDATKNGTETDVDCGGQCGATCAAGQICLVAGDCQDSVCTGGVCAAPTCEDAVENGLETDLDCGGAACPPCGPGGGCDVGLDCSGGQCTGSGGTCVLNCQDGEKNNAETGVDCGGGTCAGCPVDESCAQDTDCLSALFCGLGSKCVQKGTPGTPCLGGNQCESAFCTDGVCCNVPCGGTCLACNLAGSVGSCDEIPAGADPASECAGTLVCDGLGTCKKAQGDACLAAGECASGACVDGFCCNGPCTGACQACSNAKTGTVSGICSNVPMGQDPDNECPTECNGTGGCGVLKGPGALCGTSIECQSGFCVDGVCCENLCNGACQACTTAKTGATNGACANIATGTDPDSECAGADVCAAAGLCKKPIGASCALGSDCASASCVDGVCCGSACTSTCQACSTAKTGAANGTCANVSNNTDPDSECIGTTSCNGSGACTKLVNGAPCTLSGECQSASCVDGVCCNTACTGTCQACTIAKTGAASGTCSNVTSNTDPDAECAGNAGADVCNGAGACKEINGTPCAAGSECLSTFCADGVCCGSACAATCQACTNAKTGAASGTCSNVVSSTDPDNECTGNAGADVCASGACKEANGTPCAAGLECASTFCVDGFCCGGACTSTCQACSMAKTGAANGTCANVTMGQDPDAECTGVTTCNGSGACTKLPDGAACTLSGECQNANCVDGVCCNVACTGTCQACTTAKTGAANGTCSNITSNTDPDSECTGNSGADVCVAGACKEVNGTVCALGSECASTFCVDGVCCGSACSGLCQACSNAKTGAATGTCSNVTTSTDPDAECTGNAGADVCNGAGACKEINGTPCAAGSECLSGSCVDGVCCGSASCGTCQSCGLSGSVGTCTNLGAGTPDADTCPSPNVCIAGACKEPNGSPCLAAGECQSGFCADGYCCNATCGGTCQACSNAKSGGANGTCTSIPSNTDPDAECTTECNGSGACEAVNGTACTLAAQCQSGNCVDGYCCNATCNGTCQACSNAKSGGANGTCTSIPPNADPDSECSGSLTCNGAGGCSKIGGAACAASSECQSGFCTDGVCCNTACAGTCQACDLMAAVGTCTDVPAGEDPDLECTDPLQCAGNGQCMICVPGTIEACVYPAPCFPAVSFLSESASSLEDGCDPTMQSCWSSVFPAPPCNGFRECLSDGLGWSTCGPFL